jgi:predicted nucleotide-binding protein (sugar kinase/HSP70/actin superfamily)
MFFKKLGAEVIISPETNKEIQTVSVKCAPDEDCYSTKLYYGHVMELKNKVNYLFIPRFGSAHKTNVGCPKFVGLAEALKSTYPNLPEILMPYFSTAKSGHGRMRLIRIVFELGFKFTKNPFRIFYAFVRAILNYRKYHRDLIIDKETLEQWENSEILLNHKSGTGVKENPLKLAIVAHSYVLNDGFQSINIREKLSDMGVDYITSDQMPRDLIELQMEKLEYNMYFEYEREILGTIMHFLESKTVDGILHLIIFACGPDSINAELANRFSRRNPKVPLLQLVLDEHTGEAGINTRLEAFMDMIKRRRYLSP